MVTVLQLHGNMLSRFCFLLFYVTLISMRCFFESIKDNTRETVSEKVKIFSDTFVTGKSHQVMQIPEIPDKKI